MDRWYLILPLFSAVLYAVAALSQKNAIAAGMGPWRMSALTSWSIGGLFMPVIFFEESLSLPDPWTGAVLCGCLFFAGQVLTIVAITKGDVSIATPVLGSKVVLVALFLVLFTDTPVSGFTWLAAFLTTVGIVFLQWEPRRENRAAVLITVGTALASAACFAAADVLIVEGAREHGFFRFIATSSGTTFLLAFLLIPLFREPIWCLPAASVRHVWIGAVLIAVQAVSLGFAIGYFGDAAGSNIVYSSRGIWSVLLVWGLGHWFANTESHAGIGALTRRLIGAVLILAGIAMVFF